MRVLVFIVTFISLFLYGVPVQASQAIQTKAQDTSESQHSSYHLQTNHFFYQEFCFLFEFGA